MTETSRPFNEPTLDGVLEEDRPTVGNVITVLRKLKLCSAWSAISKNQGYEVIGTVDTKNNTEVFMADMELIKTIDPLRVTSVSVRVLGGTTPTFTLVVFVLRKSEPVVLEEQEVVLIRKKRLFWSGGGSG